MSLTNPDKVITEERLSEFYQSILPYLGGMPEAIANKFSKSDLYSTTEKIVGCWTDGKPIYQKTINFGTLPNAATKDVEHGISNLLQIIDIKTVFNSLEVAQIANSTAVELTGSGSSASITKVLAVYRYRQYIEMKTNADLSSYSAYVTLKYIKSTDAANSFNFSTETDYSTSEKIVGTWIDGKPLYQKTINFGAGPNATTKSVAHRISNLKNVIDIRCICMGSSAYVIIPFASTGYQSDAFVEGANIKVQTSTNLSMNTLYVTLQYTKTTD